jgi:hypothetical protein
MKKWEEILYSNWFFIFIQILVPVLFGFYSVGLGQDINWDFQNYHLYNSYAFLNNRMGFDLAPAGLQTYFNPLMDIFYFFLMKNFSPAGFEFILGMIHGINFILLFNICSCFLKELSIKRRLLSLALTFFGILSVGFLSEVGTTMGDDIVSLFVLTALLLVLRSVELVNEKNQKAVIGVAVAGIVAGLGIGFKLTIVIYIVAIGVSFLFISFSWTKKIFLLIAFGLGVFLGFLVTGAFWHYSVWQHFGNPIFPMMNNIFSGNLAENLPISDTRFLPKNIFEKVFYPIIFTKNPLRVAEIGYSQVNWLLIYSSFVIFLIYKIIPKIKHRELLDQMKRLLLLFFFFSYIFWLNLFGIYRYAIVLEILIPLVIFLMFSSMFDRKWMYIGVIVVLLIASAYNLHGIVDWGHSPMRESFYSIPDIPELQQKTVGSIILIGQPLAWIIPALDIKIPFVQISPNFPVSESYWLKARGIISDYGKNSVIIFDKSVVTDNVVDSSLLKVGIVLERELCRNEDFYFGKQKNTYEVCFILN